MIILTTGREYWSKGHEKIQGQQRDQNAYSLRRPRAATRSQGRPQNRPHARHAHLLLEKRQGRRRETVNRLRSDKHATPQKSGCPNPLPSEDSDQRDVRLRDDAIATNRIGAAEDSHRPETSLAQRDFAVGDVTRGIFKTRVDIGLLQVGKVLQDLLRCHPAGEHFKDVAHRDPHAANRRLAAANVGLDRDALELHKSILYKSAGKAK